MLTDYDPIEADIDAMCLGGETGERLSWLGEASGGLSPAALFDAARQHHVPDNITVIGTPGELLRDLMEGDYVVTRAFGEGPIGNIRVADMDDPTEVWPGERLPADTAVLRLESCGCANCQARR